MNLFFRVSKNRLALPVMCVLLFLLVGCMAHFGKYKTSRDAGKIFESYQVLADHNYFYTGSNTRPGAILAIHKNYILTSEHLWTPKKIDEKELRFMVDTMKSDLLNLPSGFFILDPDGRQIGLFYSAWERGPVKMEGENRVAVYLPERQADRIQERRRK